MSGASATEKLQSESVLAARRWLFGAAVLDERSLTLVVNDQSVELERKPLEVLLHLLHHAGEIVTKDELLAAVWPGRVLSDSALTSCMHKLREALSDDAQEIIRTQHGYGYRLVAPVRVETSTSPVPPRFDFKAGDHPPQRPQWSLVERLGTGGHGEAWLVQHDKTRETRMFKFAADGPSLTSLKREITLSRLLHDSLGERRDLVRILDWNLEEAPYFIEAGYSQEGSLVTWAKAQGGVDKVSLAKRLDLVAQVADALAAAHSVGVLHKDLKPSNVLIELVEDKPRIKLSDFGSGSVLDVQRLEQLGITRMGFTQAVAALDSTSGTPLYLAPEVVSGQPFTIQSDVYALGVVLYQLVIADFNKPLAPGWEQDVEDELLREDIANAADGHPEQRLADAARLAQRLRSLDERRRVKQVERAARAEADAAKLEVERIKARRVWVRLALTASVAGVTVSSLLYIDARRARDAAAEAAATSKAVTAFLSQDMFAQIGSEQRPLKDLTLREVLDGASAQVDKRFGDKPETAAEVHFALGASYLALDDAAASVQHLEQALMLMEGRRGAGSETAVDAATKLVALKMNLGQLKGAIARFEGIKAQGELQLGSQHPRVLQLSQQLAMGHYFLGEWQVAAGRLRQLLAEATTAANPDAMFVGTTEGVLGRTLLLLGEFGEAEKAFRSSIARLVPIVGARHVQVAQARTFLAETLTEIGRYADADSEITVGLDAASQWAPNLLAGYVLRARIALGRLRMEQNRLAEAAEILEGVLQVFSAHTGPEADQSAVARRPLAEVYQRQSRMNEAAEQMRLALSSAERVEGPSHPLMARMRMGLADILRQQNKRAEAWAQLKEVDPTVLAALPAMHPIRAHLRRVEGLLLVAEGDYDAARPALVEALNIFEFCYGDPHWRTQRAREELALVPDKNAKV